jgi:hypothetical protein
MGISLTKIMENLFSFGLRILYSVRMHCEKNDKKNGRLKVM